MVSAPKAKFFGNSSRSGNWRSPPSGKSTEVSRQTPPAREPGRNQTDLIQTLEFQLTCGTRNQAQISAAFSPDPPLPLPRVSLVKKRNNDKHPGFIFPCG
ncbi:hypothetical protein PAAG_03553 [Paracoccidioides lutzii Pb01]|uniref:Uncharacterized protein n=1 Tax=Paracoccidioides lutzii (strain ATCC MYA-826 / Pb01) TaxID=502779 RepID=C1GXH9_PARBA|nr:hypothetical protein PAAG_03553 [Paracoccidioides lutzii Pb01]EEH41267.2 hypothetical protein PAAG_03553 [Paracoccidioides lutzii Pb01]